MIIKISILTIFLALCSAVYAQHPTFEQVNLEVGMNVSYSNIGFYASGLSVRDFDQDGWDDITMCTDITSPPRFFKNYYGTFKEVDLGFASPYHGNYIVWVDYDNDGDLDCFGVTNAAGIYLRKRNALGALDDVTSLSGLGNLVHIEREGALFSDFNNDGLLDLFISVYEFGAPNSLFFQNSNNFFDDVSATSHACDSLDHTFHAIAFDYNDDGWMDFYEANDFYDGNMFYKNNGDSTFTEISYTNGTYQELDAMGLGIGDFDGDLDLDIHITDRFNHSMLLRNNNDGTFSEVAAQHNLDYIDGFGWGNNWFDPDLDGDNDIYVSGIIIPFLNGLPSHLYINDGQANFTADTLSEDSLFSFANAVFDFNNDRLPDIATLNSNNHPNSIWKNTTPTTSLKFSIRLEGCASNRDAIGAQMIAYDGSDKRLWMTHSTQSYCSQNADRQIIPILNGSTLDSLHVKWPIGGDTMLYNIEPNQTINLSECGTADPYAVIMVHHYPEHELKLCPGDSIILSVDGEYNALSWSTGATTDSITVSAAGVYNVTVTNQFGNSAPSTQAVIVESFDFPDFTSVLVHPACFNDGSIHLSKNSSQSTYDYLWNDSSTADSLINLTPGAYMVTVSNEGECPVIEAYQLEGPDSLNPIHVELDFGDILCNGDSTLISLNGSGGYGMLTYNWWNGEMGDSILLPAGSHAFTITDTNGCMKDTSFTITEPEALFVWAEMLHDTNFSGVGKAWVEIDGGVSPYQVQWSDSMLQSGDTAFNLTSGEYAAYVTDANGCTFTRSITVRNRTVLNTAGSPSKERLKCRQQNDRVLVKGIDLSDPLLKLDVVDMLGRSIPFQSKAIDAYKFEISINQTGVFILQYNENQACKIIQF